ncbi:acyl-CoA N-acyltransferase [Bombardia bombarda]|uniref:Acyl-CoA N-acyltransferase n=1 Tax=Bombardia bombarda TaxID=252184 RepID=A0AA40C4G3_9PEZI|nr:acyl-CoA N-acyltransferase [Bombardia bombarda]
MGPQIIYLPNGQSITVTPVFAGLFFKANELTHHHNVFPIGWTIVIHTQDICDSLGNSDGTRPSNFDTNQSSEESSRCSSTSSDEKEPQVHSYTKPTLQNDCVFISSVSNPSTSDYKPAASPTRQIAMMLWVTLYWYFHQPEPPRDITNEASKNTPAAGRPKGEWNICIKRDGVLRGRNLIPKLERMGLISSFDSAVGTICEDTDDTWAHMFVSRKMFWQLPARLFLFTLQPNTKPALRSSSPGSPVASRPGSPSAAQHVSTDLPSDFPPSCTGNWQPTSAPSPSVPLGPFFSASHLPTYYPPAPLQYTMTNNVRHPLRPKPPRMGEVFYTRFVPSVGQYLSFRVASLSTVPVAYQGPVGPNPPAQAAARLHGVPDTELLRTWHASPRVAAFWGDYAADFLRNALLSTHSFPVIGLWDGVPFGYFEIYWVKEDILGRYLGGAVADDWDRGCHVLIGEEWARGRVQAWLSSLVHWCLNSDYRTQSVCLEPRVDNSRFIQHLEYAGFSKEKEIAFPHKHAWFGRLQREAWNGPAL